MSEARIRSPSSPYKGLAAFDSTDVDALFFFGRGRETEVIAANLVASRFTVLYGPLGVGKSSVLHAGVVRRLRSLAPDAVVAAHGSWAGDAVAALLGSVAAALHAQPPAAGVRLADGLAELTRFSGDDLYLVLDQFEELFVYPGAARFAEELAETVTRPDLRVDVLLALREDALSELDVFTGRIPNVFGNYLALDRLDRTAARTAITGPIERYNELADGRAVEIEDDLVEAVLDQVEVGRVRLGRGVERGNGTVGGFVEAPYLQLVMQRLWEAEQERSSALLRRATLDELGGAQAIVRAHVVEAVQALAPEERDVAARVFNHLVTPSGTKIAHGAADLAEYARVDVDELRPVLASLGTSRIVRPADGRYEIFHDVLADAVQEWRTGYAAEQALELQRAKAERRHRRLLAVLAAALVALAAMAAVAAYALAQRSEAREQAGVARSEARSARGNELAAQAARLIPASAVETDHELGLLLAVEAVRLSPTERTADVLRRALLVSQLRAVIPDDDVTTATFSPDGTGIIVGTEGGTARLYRADATTAVTTLRPGAPVTGAVYSPDGRLALTTEEGGPARLWDAGDGTAVRSLGAGVGAASFSPDGSLVLTVQPGSVRIWRTDDGSAVAVLSPSASVQQASFAPDGTRVVTVGGGRVARVFDARTGRLVAAADHGDGITSAALTPNGQLVTTGDDGVARVWSLGGGGRVVHELTGHRSRVTAGVVSPDGDLLVTTSTDGTARTWMLPSGRLVSDLAGHMNQVTGAAFSRDGLSVVTWSTDGTARVWDPIRGSVRVSLAGHGDVVTGAHFDPSGERVLTTSANGRARLWSAEVQAELELVGGTAPPVTAASFNGNGSVAALAGRAGTEVLSATTGERIALLRTGHVLSVALSRDGSLAAVANGADVAVWQVVSAAPFDAIETRGSTTALGLSPDGRRAAFGTAAGAVRIHALGDDREIELEASGPRVTSIAFDASGGRLAAGFADGAVAAWNARDGRALYRSVEHRSGTAVRSVAFGARGRLITAGFDSTVRVWDAATGEVLSVLRGHFGSVGDAAFSPDARWAVTAGPNVAGLWDLAGGQRLLFLAGHERHVLAASFDPTGRIVQTIGAEGSLRAYRCDVCGGIPELLRLAERRVAATGRKLTAAERRRFLGDD